MSADGAVPRPALAVRGLSRVNALTAGPYGVWALFALSALVLSWWALRVRSFQPDELIYVTEGRGIALHFPSALWDQHLFPYGIERLGPLLAAIPEALFATPTALTLHKLINAVAFASVVFPVYLLGRALRLSRGFALLAAALAVAIPWLALATSFLNEPVAYPAFAWGVYACWYAGMHLGTRGDLVGLAGVAFAALARTNLAVLGAALVVTILVAELRFSRERDWRSLLRRHVPVTTVVVLSLAFLAIHGTNSLGGIYEVSLVPDMSHLAGQARTFTRILAEGVTIVPLVIAAGWAARHIVRPADRERGLFAVAAVAAIVALLYSLYGGVQEERYMIYLAPLPGLIMVVALVRRDVSWRWVAGAALAVLLLVGPTPTLTEVGNYASFAYPAQGWWGHVLVGRIGGHLPGPLHDHPATALLALLGAAAVAAVLAVRHPIYGGRRMAAAIIGAQLLVGAIAGVYSIDKYVGDKGDTNGPDFATRAWIDAVVPGGHRPRLFAESAAPNTGIASGQIAFYNRTVLTDTIDTHEMAARVDPRRGRFIGSTMPRYVVVLPQFFRSVGLVGRAVAGSEWAGYRMELVELPHVQRIAFRITGPGPDGWLEPGARARIEGLSGRCVAFHAIAPPDAAVRVTLRARGARPITRALAPGANVALRTSRPGASVLETRGRGTAPTGQPASAQVAEITSVRC